MVVLGRGIPIVMISISLLLLSVGSVMSIPTRSGTSDWIPTLPEDFESEFPLLVTIEGGAKNGTGFVEDAIWNQTAGPTALNMTEDGMKLNFTPSAPGDLTFEMRVLDSSGNESDIVVINITVVPNHPPTILPYNSTLTIDEDEDIVIDISQWVEDEDEELTFSLNRSDPLLEVNPLGFGSFQLIPDNDITGILELSFQVEDEYNNSVVLDVILLVESVPDKPKFMTLNGDPVLVGTLDMSGYEDTEIIFYFTIEDPDLIWGGDTLNLTSNQDRISINGTKGSYFPTQDDIGELIIIFTVTDAHGLSDSASVVLDIINVNDDPILKVTGMVDMVEISEDINVNFIGCSDPDEDTLSFHVRIDSGNWIETQTYHLLSFNSTGNHTVDFRVDDGNGGIKGATFYVMVVDVIVDDDDDDIVSPDDDDPTTDDDDDSTHEALSADPIMVVLVSIIGVLALVFIALLILTLSDKKRKKDPWEDFDDDEWEE